MSMDEIKEKVENGETIEDETDEVEEKEVESKFKKIISKAESGLKKHGKKIAVGAIMAAVGGVGYVIGKMRNEDEDGIEDFDDDNYGGMVDTFEEVNTEINEEQ